MIYDFIGHLFLFLLMLSIVDIFHEVLSFISAYINNTKMEMTVLREWKLAFSVAYILTYIFS